MKKLTIAVTLILSFSTAGLLFGQGGGGGFGGPGGGGARRNNPKMQMGQMFRSLGKLKRQPLTKEQATKVLAVINPWRTKDKMTDDDAKGITRKIKPILTVDQLNEIDTIQESQRARFGGGPGGGGPGGGGPGGGGAGGGGFGGGQGKGGFGDPAMRERFEKFREKMKDVNPLNVKKYEATLKSAQKELGTAPGKGGPGGGAGRMGRGVQGIKDTFAMLERTSKGATTASGGNSKKKA